MQVGSGYFAWWKSILSLALKQLVSLVLLNATYILVLFGSNFLTHLFIDFIILQPLSLWYGNNNQCILFLLSFSFLLTVLNGTCWACWTCTYVDDTICFVNSNRISYVLESLTSFHSNITFTIEIEKGNKISFLDILLISYKDLISTTMYRKKTNTDLYINWKPFSSNNWKWGTLKTLVLRTYDICSTGKYL